MHRKRPKYECACGERVHLDEWCHMCDACLDCCECDPEYSDDDELFDADELGLDPEQDDERLYRG